MSATIQNTRLRVSDLLRTVWPRNAAKHAARAAGASVRTAEAWMAARCSPSADTLLRMARENDALRAEIIRMLTTGEAADDRTVVGAHRDRHGAPRAAQGEALGGEGGVVEGAEA